MGLDDIVRNAVATAHSVTRDLQADVTLYQWTGADETEAPTFGSGRTFPALVENKKRLIRTSSEKTIHARAKVTFLALPSANGAANRREPIDPRDKIVLPDGTTGPVLDIQDLTDPQSNIGAGYLLEVWLG